MYMRKTVSKDYQRNACLVFSEANYQTITVCSRIIKHSLCPALVKGVLESIVELVFMGTAVIGFTGSPCSVLRLPLFSLSGATSETVPCGERS